MNKKFTVEKLNDLWKCKYDGNEWLFQTLEDLCLFMENYLDELKEIQSNMFTYNIPDSSIN